MTQLEQNETIIALLKQMSDKFPANSDSVIGNVYSNINKTISNKDAVIENIDHQLKDKIVGDTKANI